MSLPGYENITEINEFNFLATPTGPVQPTDGLYLRQNGEMIYLGTYGEARTRSNNNAGQQQLEINVIGIDGTNYGSFDRSSIYENLFIFKPSVPSGKSAKKVPEGEKNKGGKKRKTRRRKSCYKKSLRKRSRRKRSRRRK